MYDIDDFSVRSGRVLGEDGLIYNIVDLIQGIGGGSGDGIIKVTETEIDNLFENKEE